MGLKRSGSTSILEFAAVKLGIIPLAVVLLGTGIAGYEYGHGRPTLASEVGAVFVCMDGREVGDRLECVVPNSSVSSPSLTPSCILPPYPGCKAKWDCPATTTTVSTTSTTRTTATSTTRTTATTESTTTTTCMIVPDPEYTPQKREYVMRMEDGKFDPDTVEAFIGDDAVMVLKNSKGLYKFYDPINNKSIVLKPNDIYILEFYAQTEGEFILGCTEQCEEPVKAKVLVRKPYRVEC